LTLKKKSGTGEKKEGSLEMRFSKGELIVARTWEHSRVNKVGDEKVPEELKGRSALLKKRGLKIKGINTW